MCPAVARLEKARANVDVSQQEFDRLKALYEDNQNASQKALEGAQGALRSDQADVQAAEQDLLLQTAALRQDWGEVIAKWVIDDPAPLNRFLSSAIFWCKSRCLPGHRRLPLRASHLKFRSLGTHKQS